MVSRYCGLEGVVAFDGIERGPAFDDAQGFLRWSRIRFAAGLCDPSSAVSLLDFDGHDRSGAVGGNSAQAPD